MYIERQGESGTLEHAYSDGYDGVIHQVFTDCYSWVTVP
jgi:hypothetical protein